MKYKFYTTSVKTWIAMLESIKEAREYIFIEMYILVDDTKQFDFINLLKEKAKQGIRIKLMLDYFGSFGFTNEVRGELEALGVEVSFFSHWLHRVHRKMIIVDGRVAFLGGVNIHHSAHKWTDLGLKIEGVFVKSLSRSFARTYFFAGGQDEFMKSFINITMSRKIKMWFIDHWPQRKKNKLKTFYKQKISEAKNTIRLVTPYFIPKRWLMIALDQAVLRGVSVEVIVPSATDSIFLDRANYFYMLRMHNSGIKFYLFKGMNHAKAMLVDDNEGVVSSANLDSLSFDINAESGVFFQNKKMVKDLSDIVEDWKKDAEVFDPMSHRLRWFDFILAPVVKLIKGFL